MKQIEGVEAGQKWQYLLIFCHLYERKFYSVDSIKRTVHLAFHGLFSLLKILFTISKQYF